MIKMDGIEFTIRVITDPDGTKLTWRSDNPRKCRRFVRYSKKLAELLNSMEVSEGALTEAEREELHNSFGSSVGPVKITVRPRSERKY